MKAMALSLKKIAWTLEEDQKLIAYINTYGVTNWSLMPKAAGIARSGKSCRLRWMNYLRPDLKRGGLTMEEIDTIIRLHESLGNKWSQIAGQLPGRTDNEIKNFWHTHVRKFDKTVPRWNSRKPKRNKREEKGVASYDAKDSHSENSSTITDLTQFPIAESYCPSIDSCSNGIINMQNISSSYSSEPISHEEINEKLCMETSSVFDDLQVAEMDLNLIEWQDFSLQAQEYKPQDSMDAFNNDELTSFWFNVFKVAL